MRTAIVHYWLDGYRGGERVIGEICHFFPDADIFTHIYVPEKIPETIKKHKIQTTFIQKLPFAKKLSRMYLPLMPLALKFLNLKEYDLIISSESGPAKGIIKRPDALHICYCHSPMRYIWDMEKEYAKTLGVVSSKLWKILACFLRKWDYNSGQKVDYFIANSNFIAARIRKFYKRKSTVIPPPVNTEQFDPSKPRKDYYLIVSQVVPYKKVDLVVESFNKLRLPLLLIGNGSGMEKVKAMAKDNIKIITNASFETIKSKLEHCKAFVFAGKEDFGIVFAEAQAAGAPVIAYGKGGVKDIVIKNKTGIFFYKQTSEALCKCVQEFEEHYYNLLTPQEIANNAKRFSKDNFRQKFSDFIKKL